MCGRLHRARSITHTRKHTLKLTPQLAKGELPRNPNMRLGSQVNTTRREYRLLTHLLFFFSVSSLLPNYSERNRTEAETWRPGQKARP
jgi:hypothetical protein